MPNRKQPALFAAMALLALVAVLFAPALFQGKILAPLDITSTLLPPWGNPEGKVKPHNHYPSDAVSQYLPYRLFAEKSLREDGYIGWNPYEMGGYSLAANTMALPGSWPMQLHRWLPFKDAWNLGIIGEFLIAGTGMLVFLRGRNNPWLPCIIGSVAYMLNAQFIIWIYHRWALGSFCWMPWVLWAFADGFSVRPLPGRLLLLPAFLALAMLGGSLQHIAFIVLACGCLAAASFDFRRPLANAPTLLGWLLAFVLSLGIAAFSLVPQIQGYLSNVAIGHVRGGIGYEDGITQPLFHALLIPARIWPWLAGDPQSMDAFRLLKSGYMSLNYLGTIPMLLGFAGLFVRAMPRGAKWLIAVGLIIPLTPLVGPLYHRVELLFILGAAWMAAEMLAHLARSQRAQPTSGFTSPSESPAQEHRRNRTTLLRRFNWQQCLISSVAAIGIALLAGTLIPSSLRGKLEKTLVSKALARSADSQFGADNHWIASRATEWTRRFSLTHPRTAWVYGLLVLGTAGLILSSSCNNQKSSITNRKSPPLLTHRSLGHTLILCATTLELSTLFHVWTTFSDPAGLSPKNAAIETIRSLAGPHRVLQSAPGTGFATMFATPNLLAAQSIASIDGYESIQYRSPLIVTKGMPEEMRLNLAGVGIAIQPDGMPQPGTESWSTVDNFPGYKVRKNPAVPAAITVGYREVPTTLSEITSVLPNAAPVKATFKTPNRLTFLVPPAARWIRISQNWHPGWSWRSEGGDWKPFINGTDAACWIGDLPNKAAHIEVRFLPRPTWITVLSWTSLLAFLAIALYGRPKASAPS